MYHAPADLTVEPNVTYLQLAGYKGDGSARRGGIFGAIQYSITVDGWKLGSLTEKDKFKRTKDSKIENTAIGLEAAVAISNPHYGIFSLFMNVMRTDCLTRTATTPLSS